MATKESTSITTINNLNEYCLMHIFQYLSFPDKTRIERVNKRWEAIGKGSWCLYSKRLEIGNDTNGFPGNEWSKTKSPDEILQIMRNIVKYRGYYLQEIFFTPNTGDYIPAGTLQTVIPLCPKLIRLQAENLIVSPEDMDAIIQNCQNLESLGVGQGSYFSEEQLRQVLINNPRLNKLRIVGCCYFTGDCLEVMPNNGLEKLEVRYCPNFRLNREIAKKFSDSMNEFTLYSNFTTDHGVNSVVVFKNIKKITLSLNIDQLRDMDDNVIQHARDNRTNMYLTSCGPVWALQFHR